MKFVLLALSLSACTSGVTWHVETLKGCSFKDAGHRKGYALYDVHCGQQEDGSDLKNKDDEEND